MISKVRLPGVPAISTLNVRSMVLFSSGDPLWSLEDKKKQVERFTSRSESKSERFNDLRNGNESQKKCLNFGFKSV